MNHRTTSLSPAAQFKPHLPTFKNKSTKSHKTCVNCGTTNTTLWRKFKAAEEVKSKRPDKNVDDSRPDMKGKIGCNACCLYWALHGKHRPPDMKRDQAPTRRKRKKEKGSCREISFSYENSNHLDHSTGGGAGGSSLGLRIPNYFSNPSMIAGYHHHHQQQ